MDKLFRKRTEKGNGNGRSAPTTKVTKSPTIKSPATKSPAMQSPAMALPKLRPRPTKPTTNMAPSLDIDIRNSLIMPSMTERFSVLLPGLSAAPDVAIRDLLHQQRTRADGPSLTEEEEELLFAELRGNAPSQMSFSQMTNISEWDGNPPPFDNDWASSLRGGGSMAGSVSSPSMGRSPSESYMSTSQGDRSFMSGTSASPTKSMNSMAGMTSSVMDRGRVLPGRSHGFSSNQSFRDNNYLSRVAKEKEEHTQLSPPGSLSRRKLVPGQHGTPPLPTNARHPSVSRSDLRGTNSPSSERTVTPTAMFSSTPVARSPASGGLPASPAASLSTLNRQRSNQSSNQSTPIERKTSNPLGRRPSNNSPLERHGSNSSNGHLERQMSNRSNTQLARQTSNRSDGGAASPIRQAPPATTELRTVPLRDEPSKLRTKPVGGAPQQRQSLMGLNPAQAKRISMALMEIETHLGKQGSEEDAPAGESYVVLNEDEEEILDGDDTEAEENEDNDEAKGNVLDVGPPQLQPLAPVSSEASVDFSPQFPFALSPPASSFITGLPGTATQTPSTKPPSLPASPRTHDLQAMQASQNGAPLQPESPTVASGSSPARSSPARRSNTHSSHNGSNYDPRESSSTQYSEADYSQPHFKPIRPQPVRHTPSPAFQVMPSVNGSIPGYVPGQPRPVGSRSAGGLSPSTSTPPQTPFNTLGSMRPSATTANIPKHVEAGINGGVQLARSKSAQLNGSRSNTPTQHTNNINHVPPPGVLAARHQASHSISDMGTWRSTSSIGHSPKSSKHSPSSSKHSPTSSKHSPSSSLRSPMARVNGKVDSLHSRTASSPITPMTATSKVTQSPSRRFNHRPSHDSLASSTCSTSFDTEDSSPWDALIRQESPENAAIMTPTDGQDRADLDLLKSMSGMGKEELAMIQERLVEKARSERDKIRTEVEGAPVGEAPVHPVNGSKRAEEPPLTITTHQQTSSQDWEPAASRAESRAEELSQPAELRQTTASPPGIATAPARLDGGASGSDVFTQFPTHRVPRSELPKGPPPARPQPPSVNVLPTDLTAMSPAPDTAHTAPESGAHSPTHGRKWIDENPTARRDIEERITAATTDLFRSASHRQHKRSLSKKHIGMPTLVTASTTVPSTPITALENPYSKPQKTGMGSRKLSGRWKKGFFKKHSGEGLPPPMPTGMSPAGISPAGISSAGISSAGISPASISSAGISSSPSYRRPTTPAAAVRAMTPVASHSNSTTPKASHAAVMAPPLHPPSYQPSQQKAPSGSTSAADIKGFRFPVSANGANGRTRTPPQSPQRSSPVPLRSSPRSKTASPVHPSPAHAILGGTDLERTLSGSYAQHILDATPPDEGDHITHVSDEDPSVQRFYEAGRAVGLDDKRLSELLETKKPSLPSSPQTPSIPEIDHNYSYPKPPYPLNAAPGRIPSPVVEDIVTFGDQAADHTVVRRTLVLSSGLDSPPASPVRDAYHRMGPSPLHQQMSPPTSPTNKRGNSIRRKPIQYSGSDLSLVERSPTMNLHQRTESIQSGSFTLPPANKAAVAEPQYPRQQQAAESPTDESAPPSATSRSSVGGFPHSSTNGSFIDYYAEDRNSQALEITEYADGRVVWNIVNALRNDEHDQGSSVAEGSRASMASINSQSSNYTGSRRESQRMDDHVAGGAQPPWHVGPTAGLSFIRRPETRMFYTNSADVADLIDQLSKDHAGATRGRIDIRPTGPGFSEVTSPTHPDFSAPTSPDFSSPANPAFDNSPSGHGYVPAPHRKASHLNPASSLGHGSRHSHDHGNESQSPSAASFLSDTSGERTVEDRLQSLMDRLRSEPGGIGRQ